MKYTPHAPYELEHSFIYRFAFLDRDSESSSHFEVWRSIILHIVFYFAQEAVALVLNSSCLLNFTVRLHNLTIICTSRTSGPVKPASIPIILWLQVAMTRSGLQLWATSRVVEWELKVKLGFSKSFLSFSLAWRPLLMTWKFQGNGLRVHVP